MLSRSLPAIVSSSLDPAKSNQANAGASAVGGAGGPGGGAGSNVGSGVGAGSATGVDSGGSVGSAVGVGSGVGTLLPVLWLVFSPLGPAALRGVELAMEPTASGLRSEATREDVVTEGSMARASGASASLQQSGILGQRAGGDEPQHVGAGAGPVDGVRLGQGVAGPVEQGEHGAGVPGQ